MSEKKVENVLNTLKSSVKRLWDGEPAEVQELKKLLGHGGFHYFIMTHPGAEGNLNTFHDELWTLRDAVKKGRVPVKIAGLLAADYTRITSYRLDHWFKMKTTKKLLDEAIEAFETVNTQEEYTKLMDQLMLFIGKLSSWIANYTPQYALASLYDWLVFENSAKGARGILGRE